MASHAAGGAGIGHSAVVIHPYKPADEFIAGYTAIAMAVHYGAAPVISQQTANTDTTGHIQAHDSDILDHPSIINNAEESYAIFSRAIDKQVPYLTPLTVEAAY
jgi:hypothetical protein